MKRIFRRNQVIITTLAIMIAAAGYLNYSAKKEVAGSDVFEAGMMEISDEDIQERFGHLVNAFQYGAPPHGGLAYGLDRLVMLMTGASSIRDVIAFPKVQNASDLMMNCPDVVDQKQLDDLAIAVTRVEEAAAEEE